MIAKVVYTSKTGNTRKIAEAIAESVGGKAETAESCKITENVDVLFLGGAIYATYNHDFHPSIKQFLSGIDKKKVRKVATFGTYAFASSIDKLNVLVKNAGLSVLGENFVCKGKFLFFNLRHPSREDVEGAKDFAAKMMKKT